MMGNVLTTDESCKRFFNRYVGILRAYSKTFCKMATEPITPDGPFIVVANHLTERDFYPIAYLVRAHMYILVSEHLFRSKHPYHRLVVTKLNPISHAKGSKNIHSIHEMLSRIRRGNNILLFPEGHRSADGVTMKVSESIGKFIKMSKSRLITLKITGGYFTEPRWAYTVRKGKIGAGIVGNYSAEALEKMSAAEITDIINRDIYEDAYARQLEEPKRYRGKRLAEGLENHLFLCPRCKGVSTLKTKGDRFWCGCGLEGKYDEYAMLSGDKLEFRTVRDWSEWQNREYLSMLDKMEGILCQDEAVTLYKIDSKAHKSEKLCEALLQADRAGLHIGELVFDYPSIFETAFMSRGNTLYFQTKSGYYELYKAGLAQMKYKLIIDKFHGM